MFRMQSERKLQCRTRRFNVQHTSDGKNTKHKTYECERTGSKAEMKESPELIVKLSRPELRLCQKLANIIKVILNFFFVQLSMCFW